MKTRIPVPRSIRSWHLANIILEYGLFDEFKIYCYQHPRIKSKYRLATLFLLHKKLLYKPVFNTHQVNMDSLDRFYFGD